MADATPRSSHAVVSGATAEAAADRRDERGSGTGLVVAVLVVVLVVMGAVLIAGGYLLASHRARVAADLAALSAAAAIPRGSDPCRTARAVVDHPGIRVTRCTWTGDQIDYVVAVEVTVRVPGLVPRLPQSVAAHGSAGPVQLGDPDR